MISSAGHLNPGDAQVQFQRLPLDLPALVRHVWIVRWSLPAGECRPQRVLTYPAGNIVLSPASAELHGPDPSVQIRRLQGTSWTVGILLRASGISALAATEPARLVGTFETVPGAPLAEVAAAMSREDGANERVLAILRAWLAPFADRLGEAARLANDAAQIAEESTDILRVFDLAARVGVSERTLTRLVREHIGVSPKWLIECRRLQIAATTLFSSPDTDLATLSADLGYADQAHFTRRYRQVLGETPDQTRRRLR